MPAGCLLLLLGNEKSCAPAFRGGHAGMDRKSITFHLQTGGTSFANYILIYTLSTFESITWYHDQNRWGRQWFVGSLTGQTCLHQSYWILGHFLEQGMQIHLARPSLVALCNLFLTKNLSPQRKWFIYHWAETCIHYTSPRETRRCKKRSRGKKQKTGETIIYCDNKPIGSWSGSFSTWLLARDVFSTPAPSALPQHDSLKAAEFNSTHIIRVYLQRSSKLADFKMLQEVTWKTRYPWISNG